ncbi:MAG: tRNA threonylcarbamoyladenosine biosynthesis protein TsaB [Cytophagales bacterium]|jgi:tRNA threonylcarbamoyladenosine biosynthesis protein TsaB|nr:tRNA (adenosine(37)-N6)-threonylcarbamoyltransferase complex dimerization subunit type 1 TsaB [Bacteroidota bacterium]MBS1981916.1 tRNA (adenosine(37)-N6)-threonylcarbamoyltransferase complex dimerization subunit type 1 TsaB [Bacteroidota bacterium]WHZ07541.1 MAG: tRNA threonylcarbamoyladenosine biosynthesis protein TsaB [Cytophagales bacterium]
MALLLSLETSSHFFSCALYADGLMISYKESLVRQSTASMLTVFINNLFEETQLTKDQLSVVVISSGPGSYTGLRIGTSTAKGICYASQAKLIAVNTLELLTYQFLKLQSKIHTGQFLLCPMLDARRDEVYCALFSQDSTIIEKPNAKIIDQKSFLKYLDQCPIYFFGEGSAKCKKIITHPQAIFIDEINPSAAYLGEIGWQMFNSNKVESIEEFEPFYLKDFIIKKPITLS